MKEVLAWVPRFLFYKSTSPLVGGTNELFGQGLILNKIQQFAVSVLRHSVPLSVLTLRGGPNFNIQLWTLEFFYSMMASDFWSWCSESVIAKNINNYRDEMFSLRGRVYWTLKMHREVLVENVDSSKNGRVSALCCFKYVLFCFYSFGNEHKLKTVFAEKEIDNNC